MDFTGVKDISIYGTDCIVDISRGDDAALRFVSAKEKYFELNVDDNGMFTVRQKDRNLFYKIILHKIEFKLILPKWFRGKLRFRNKNGGLYVSGADFADVELSTDNGKFDLKDIKCDSFQLKMRNGTVLAKNLNAANGAGIKCTNGNIKIESAVTSALNISCNNAAMSIIDVEAKKFECTTSNGAIDASGIVSDELKLETSNGKITAAPLGKRDDYKLSLDTRTGAITVDGVAYKKLADVAGMKKLFAKTANGDIDVRFF